jgi:hypothetical protein
MPVPVVAYEVACGSGALTSIAAALEDATPAARMTASEDSILKKETRAEAREEEMQKCANAMRGELLLVPFSDGDCTWASLELWSSGRGGRSCSSGAPLQIMLHCITCQAR